ncbi:hypothetical protein PSE_0515 [Pseudovibrio sp. FO-BEG1]|nr:hypothetical protein PSE_0515 [Pseudovibrio sp. FO-BEG1]
MYIKHIFILTFASVPDGRHQARGCHLPAMRARTP